MTPARFGAIVEVVVKVFGVSTTLSIPRGVLLAIQLTFTGQQS